jgi:F0F1-type ATP synthase assembly protein I
LIPLSQEIQYSLGRLNTVTQIFKIVAPFVFLSAAFATLNARLGMPPFALFLIALSLTDGATT